MCICTLSAFQNSSALLQVFVTVVRYWMLYSPSTRRFGFVHVLFYSG